MSKQAALSLGTEDIRKLLMRYALPAIIAMTASSLYNMMDSIFIGHGVGAMAIAGLAVRARKLCPMPATTWKSSLSAT